MVCPNCGSSDIISVQGQNFCINCGKSVPASSSAVEPPADPKVTAAAAQDALATAAAALNNLEQGTPATDSPPEPVAVKAAPPAKPKEEAPKPEPAPAEVAISPELPESPLPKIIKHKQATLAATPEAEAEAAKTAEQAPAPKPAAKVVIAPTPVDVETPVAKVAENKQTPVAVAPTPPKPAPTVAAPEPAVRPAKVLRDIAPAAPPKPAPQEPAKPAHAAKKRAPVRIAASIGLAIHAASSPKLIGFGLVGVMVTSLVPATVWAGFVATPDRSAEAITSLIADQYQLAISVAAGLLGVISLGYLLRLYAGGAIIYGEAKLFDRRNSAQKTWSRAGLSALPAAAMLDILTALAIILLGIAGIGLYLELPMVLSGPQWLYMAITGLGTAFLSLAVFGLFWSRLIAQNATTLGSYSAFRALRLGWVIYWQQWSHLLGAFLLLAVINILGLAVYAAFSLLAAVSVSGGTPIVTILITGLTGWLVATLIFSTLLVLNTTAVYHLYRQSVEAHPEDAPKLLAGKHAHKPSKSLPIVGTVAVASLIAAVIIIGQYLQSPIISALTNL